VAGLTFIIEQRDQWGVKLVPPVQVLLDSPGGEPLAVVSSVMAAGFEGVVWVLDCLRVGVLDSVEVWWWSGYW
jgi:hypothetical protein